MKLLNKKVKTFLAFNKNYQITFKSNQLHGRYQLYDALARHYTFFKNPYLRTSFHCFLKKEEGEASERERKRKRERERDINVREKHRLPLGGSSIWD